MVVKYHFLTPTPSPVRLEEGDFVEWVEYSGDLYGTLRSGSEGQARKGADDVILEIELRGARAVREGIPEARLVFIAPPSLEELGRRLRRQRDRSDAAIARRLGSPRPR